MPTLSDRLKALGVSLGAADIKPPPARRGDVALETLLPGRWLTTRHGEVFLVERRYPATHRIGAHALRGNDIPPLMAAWARQPQLATLSLNELLFVDIETSGLSVGGGVYAFLIGAGRFQEDEFILRQFFLRDPTDESAQLAAFEDFAAPCRALVTFNGKAFDIPMINGRYVLNRWPFPLQGFAHLDLLHLARRLWKDSLPSRALGSLEAFILGAERAEEDVPGWQVADLYLEYLASGDATLLQGVFYHNEMDVLSMAALLNHMAALLEDPLAFPQAGPAELCAIARLHAEMGEAATAQKILQRVLDETGPQSPLRLRALDALAALHKKQGDFAAAIPLWEEAAACGEIHAHVELAKFYEHRRKEIATARAWTLRAINLLANGASPPQRARWLPELEHRLARLERKLISDDGRQTMDG